jgi:hypothetical protein
MLNFIKLVWRKFKSLLTTSDIVTSQCESTNTTAELRKLGNSCALTALSRVDPKLSYNDISNAFYNCCDKWPSSGVKHNELNVVLRYLNIFDNFSYIDNSQSNLRLSDYSRKKEVYILLILGHYTVLCNGKIYDSYGYGNLSKSTKVYCSWMLTTGK